MSTVYKAKCNCLQYPCLEHRGVEYRPTWNLFPADVGDDAGQTTHTWLVREMHGHEDGSAECHCESTWYKCISV